MTSLELVTPATQLAVSADDLKSHLRMNNDDETNLLDLYSRAAQQLFENLSGRCLMTSTWRANYNRWTKVIELPKSPCQSVSSVTFRDTNGSLQTLDTANYKTDVTREPARVIMKTVYPSLSVYDEPKVSVTFVAGYTAATVPHPIRVAILLQAATMYENREDVITGTIVAQLPLGFRAIADQYRVGKINWGE